MAQEVFNEYVTQPDVWRPANISEPGVDAGGDLNLSLPVLTVPGRNGLDFAINLSYKSGIKPDQASSWVGLGWSFDPGSITRDVQSVVVSDVNHAVDFADIPSYQPDMYYVTTPGGGFTMVRTGGGGNTTLPNRSTSGDFVASQWRPWKITYTLGDEAGGGVAVDGIDSGINYDDAAPSPATFTAKADYKQFLLTDESGTRYVFGKPTMASHASMGPTSSNGIAYHIAHYVSTWRLVAILGPDYLGNPYEPPSLDAKGSWIKFEYTDPVTRQRPYPQHGQEINQARYLSAIVTPTHRAEFWLGAEAKCEINCGDNGSFDWTLKNGVPGADIYSNLNAIVLKENKPNIPATSQTIIKKVQFDYADEDGHDAFTGGAPRLKLDHIYFVGRDLTSELPGYSFTYWERDLLSGGVDALHTDDFGYYSLDPNDNMVPDYSTGDDEAKAWSLKQITYPTGGRLTVHYENDYIHPVQIVDPVAGTSEPYELCHAYYGITGDDPPPQGTQCYPITTSNNRQGGVRVTRLVRYSGVPGDLVESTFLYGEGRVSGVPPRYFTRNYGGTWFKANSRGKAAVYYPSVRRTNSDGTYAITEYATDLNYPSVYPIASTVFSIGTAHTVVQDNGEINWGIAFRTSTGGTADRNETTTVQDVSRARLARALELGPTPVNIWWRYANRVVREEVKNDGIYRERVFMHDPQTGLVKRIEERIPGEVPRVTRIRHGYDEYTQLNTDNVLTAVIQQDLSLLLNETPIDSPEEPENEPTVDGCSEIGGSGAEEEVVLKCPTDTSLGASGNEPDQTLYVADDTGLTFLSATITTLNQDGDLSDLRDNNAPISTAWRPQQVFEWNAPGPGSLPAFNFATRSPGSGGSGVWQTVTTFTDYDAYGHVTSQQDALGRTITFHYGTESQPCSPGGESNPSRNSYLTCVEMGGLSQKLTYNTDGTLRTIQDAAGSLSTYGYDTHGRLDEVQVDNTTVQEYSYGMSRASRDAAFDANKPNAIITKAIADPNTIYESRAYLDGFGEALQSHARYTDAVTGDELFIASAVERLRNERTIRTFKPIVLNDPGGHKNLNEVSYESNFEAKAQELYGIGALPYTEQKHDVLGRPTDVYPPGVAVGSPHQTVAYDTQNQRALDGTITGKVAVATSTDEDGNTVRSFTNALGQQYLSRAYVAFPEATVPVLPDNVSGTASVTALGAGGGYRIEDVLPFGAEGAAYLNDVSVRWSGLNPYIFTAPITQVVHYTLTPTYPSDPETAVFLRFRVYEGNQLLFASSLKSPLVGSFLVEEGAEYRVEFQAGIDQDASTTQTFVGQYALEFKRNGMVTLIQDTRFEYDDSGNLIKVMPPNYFAPPSGSQAEDWVTTYQYNTLGQLVAKATPDADGDDDDNPTNEAADGVPDFVYAYDQSGNLRFSQDPNQRSVDSVAFSVYDALGRPLINGVGPAVFSALEANPGSTLCNATDTPFATSESVLECTPDSWHTVQRYDAPPDASAFPWNAMPATMWSNLGLQHTNGRLVATAHRLNLEDVAIKEFLNLFGYTFNTGNPPFQAHTTIDAQGMTIMGDADVTFVAGERITLKTGFRVQGGGRFSGSIDSTLTEIAGADWLITAYNYDRQGRIIDYYQYNAILGLIHSQYTYDLQGNVRSIKYQPGKTDRLYTWYDYDDLGRLTTVWTHDQDSKGSATKEASYSYRPNGQVQQLALGHSDFIAPISYTYHVRDWLTHINNPENIGDNVFAMKLFYDNAPTDAGDNSFATYRNGNVAAIDWVTQASSAPSRARYGFAYDGLNRLIQGRFTQLENGNWSTWNENTTPYDLASVNYDPNGNITSLHRKNQLGSGNPISYTYEAGTNRLLEASGGVLEDGAAGVVTYEYDANGNATSGRGFSDAEYDYRNLPLSMTVGGGEMAMRYYADGQRFYKALGTTQGWYYIRGLDGSVIAVYDENCILRYWNILSGSRPIGRVEPAFGVALGQAAP